MAASFLALLDVASRHTVKIASVGAKGATASMSVTLDDMAVTAGKPSSEGIPQHLEHRFVLDSAKLSGKNKLWQYPLLLALVALYPALLAPVLALGALYLTYEGWHESHEMYHHHTHKPAEPASVALDDEGFPIPEPLVVQEPVTPDRLREIVREAGVLDVILSAEIGIIALKGMGATESFVTAAKTYASTKDFSAYFEPLVVHGPGLMVVALVATLGVYLPVWVLLRADNWAEHLTNVTSTSPFGRLARAFGRSLVPSTQYIMRGLPYVGIAAMLAVGGHILLHTHHGFGHAVSGWAEAAGAFGLLVEYGTAIAAGLAAGIIVDKAGMPLIRPCWKMAKALYVRLRGKA